MTKEAQEPLREPDARKGAALLADYFTEDELAAELRKSRKTIRNWRALGEGPPRTLVGRAVYYHRDHVRAWLERQCVEAA